MIGPLEIAIVLVILLVAFGGYKKLPQLGRSAGKSARVGTEKAKELAGTVGDKVGDKFDPAEIGRSAGKGLREAREVRDSLTGSVSAPAEAEEKAKRDAERPSESRRADSNR